MRNRSDSDGQCAVFKEINRQLIQVGNDFGITEDGGTGPTTELISTNRVIHWGNDLLALNHNTIFKFDVLAGGSGGTGDWETFYTFADRNVSALQAYVMGWTPSSIDGSGVLVTAYPSDNNLDSVIFVKIDKDLNVTEGPQVTHAATNFNLNENNFVSPTPYRNQIIFTQRIGNGYIFSYDLKADILTRITPSDYSGSANPGRSQIVIMRDKPFLIDQGVGQNIGIWRLEGVSAPRVGIIPIGTHRVGGDGCYASIDINDKLYVCGAIGPFAGDIRLFEIIFDSSNNVSTVNDISSLLPTEITTLVPGEVSQAMWRVDNISNGPENLVYELELSRGGSNTRSLFEWINAPTGVLSFIGNTMTGREFSWIDVTEGSPSPFVWSGSGTLNVSQPCLALNLDGLTIDCDFEVFGSVGASGISLELYFDKEGEIDSTRGAISSTTLGVLAGNRVTGLSDGDKLTVGWSAVADGIVTGDNPKLHGRVFIP